MNAAAINLSELAKHFSDEDAARDLLEKMRWNGMPACPHCGGVDPYKLTPKATSKKPGRKGLYKCKACRKQFTVTVGTVFEDSRIAISKWLLAIHLMASSKKGMSAHQLHRMLGISYKAAWFMCHRLRYAMDNGPLGALLSGVVEVDEAYIGGKRKGGVGRIPANGDKKLPIVALVERSGRAVAFPVERVDSATLHAAIVKHVDPRRSELMTDEATIYGGDKVAGMKRQSVRHRSGEFVRGNVHSNTVEGFFSLLKRGITGTFHHVSSGHLHRYCDEFSFRYSARKMSDGERANLLVNGAEGKRLTYKQPSRA